MLALRNSCKLLCPFNYLFGKQYVLQIFLVMQSLVGRIGRFDFYAFVYLFMVYFLHLLGLRVRFATGHGRLSVLSVMCCQ